MLPSIRELGPQAHNVDGPLGSNAIMTAYMDPLGNRKNIWLGYPDPREDLESRSPNLGP